METITISKAEYEELKSQSFLYKKLASDFFESLKSNNLTNVMNDFKNTNLYSDEFLKELEDGLSKSSYLTNIK